MFHKIGLLIENLNQFLTSYTQVTTHQITITMFVIFNDDAVSGLSEYFIITIFRYYEFEK